MCACWQSVGSGHSVIHGVTPKLLLFLYQHMSEGFSLVAKSSSYFVSS